MCDCFVDVIAKVAEQNTASDPDAFGKSLGSLFKEASMAAGETDFEEIFSAKYVALLSAAADDGE
jgi:hypothetical protein